MESLFDVSSILNVSSDSTPVCCVSCNMYCLVASADIIEHFICSKCVTNNDLVQKVRDLEEHIKNLISIQEMESWLDSVCPNASVVSNSALTLTGASTANEKLGTPERSHGDWVTVRSKTLNKAKPKARVSGLGSPIQTQNRYSALSSSPNNNNNVLILGDSAIQNVKVRGPGNRSLKVKCFPCARVSDMEARVSSLADNAVSTMMVHVGGNDIRFQQSEVLKSRFISMCKARRKCRDLIVSGPLPRLFIGDIVYSRLVSFNTWLETWCHSNRVSFVHNWDDFWERLRFFTCDGVHLNWRGSFVLSQNLACKLQD
uniref:SGNH hydrolase-type esterase domain-containing protein n=1 Tax=Scleropages formosus TaxID=113540 RepID=A0A8C9TYY8_SCLFO